VARPRFFSDEITVASRESAILFRTTSMTSVAARLPLADVVLRYASWIEASW
jgi:hypothetical protein